MRMQKNTKKFFQPTTHRVLRNNNFNIIFEGEYLNGKKWNGNLKEYNDYGNLEFEGKYLNGERNGKGKEYNNNGKLIFEGEYLNGKRNGKGKQYHYHKNNSNSREVVIF